MTSDELIAVFGATGAQGCPVAQALLAAGRPVRALARTEDKLRKLGAQGAQTAVVDLTDADSVRTALSGASAAFVQLPITAIPEVVRAQAAAVATALLDAQVPLAVVTLSGLPSSTPVGVASFDSKAMAKKVFIDSGAPIIGFEPTGYLGNLSAFFSAPSVVHHDELRYPLPDGHRQPWISTEDQAALAVAAIGRPDLTGRWFRIGEQYTGSELAEHIGAGLGRLIRYVPMTPGEFGRLLAPVMGEEVGAVVAADYAMLGRRPPALGLDAGTGEVRRELGVEVTSVADWARTQDWEAAAIVLGGH